MYHIQSRLFFLLLLSITLLSARKNNESLSSFITDKCKDCPSKLLGLVLIKQYENRLPAEKFMGAEILKRYIAYNTDYSDDTAEKIAQCTSSIARYTATPEVGNKTTYSYEVDNPLISVPKTFARELLFDQLSNIYQTTVESLQLKHPPEIEENEKLYQGCVFIIKSFTRHTIDRGLDKIISEFGFMNN